MYNAAGGCGSGSGVGCDGGGGGRMQWALVWGVVSECYFLIQKGVGVCSDERNVVSECFCREKGV